MGQWRWNQKAGGEEEEQDETRSCGPREGQLGDEGGGSVSLNWGSRVSAYRGAAVVSGAREQQGHKPMPALSHFSLGE